MNPPTVSRKRKRGIANNAAMMFLLSLFCVDTGSEVGGWVDITQAVVYPEIPGVVLRHQSADILDSGLCTLDRAGVSAGVVVAPANHSVAFVFDEVLLVTSVDGSHVDLLSGGGGVSLDVIIIDDHWPFITVG